jgi:hypothetical protein
VHKTGRPPSSARCSAAIAGFDAPLCSSVYGVPMRPSTAGSHGWGWCLATMVMIGGQPVYSNTAYMNPIPPPSPATIASVNGSPVCGAHPRRHHGTAPSRP